MIITVIVLCAFLFITPSYFIGYLQGFKKSKEMAVEALKKQDPIEHHHTIVGECSGGEKIRTSICPRCLGCILTVEEEFPRFCDWCGQAIDWNK